MLTAMLMQKYSDNLLFIMIASVSLGYLVMLLRKGERSPLRLLTTDKCGKLWLAAHGGELV